LGGSDAAFVRNVYAFSSLDFQQEKRETGTKDATPLFVRNDSLFFFYFLSFCYRKWLICLQDSITITHLALALFATGARHGRDKNSSFKISWKYLQINNHPYPNKRFYFNILSFVLEHTGSSTRWHHTNYQPLLQYCWQQTSTALHVLLL
jgi:hypothetical protein